MNRGEAKQAAPVRLASSDAFANSVADGVDVLNGGGSVVLCGSMPDFFLARFGNLARLLADEVLTREHHRIDQCQACVVGTPPPPRFRLGAAECDPLASVPWTRVAAGKLL